MTTLDLLPEECNIHEVAGADLSIVIPCYEPDGVTPVDVSAYTFAGDVFRAGVVIDSFTPAVSGAGNNIVTLTLTDTELAAIGTGRGLDWALKVTAGGLVDWWYAGEFRLYNPGTPRPKSGSSNGLTARLGASITTLITVGVPGVDAAGNMSVADVGGFYAGATVEAALQEVGTTLALKADIASPTLTGTPAAPTAVKTTATIQIATTAFVDEATDGWYLSGTTGDMVVTPNNAAFRPTTSLDVRLAINASTYTTGVTRRFMGLYGASGNFSWAFQMGATNTLVLVASIAGTTAITTAANATPTFAANTSVCIRAAVDLATGNLDFFHKVWAGAADLALDTGWTQLGTTRSTALTSPLFASTALVTIGALDNGGANPFAGSVLAAQIKVDGTVVASPRFTRPDGVTTDAQSRMWTHRLPIQTPLLSGSVVVPNATLATEALNSATADLKYAPGGTAGNPAESRLITTADHGPLYDFPRPTWAGKVFWYGSAEPVEAVPGDAWTTTAGDWVSAHDASLLTDLDDGDPVNSWPDMVGGLDAVDVGAPPTFVAADGGVPAHIHFFSDALVTPAYSLVQPFTMIVVFRATTLLGADGSRPIVTSINGANTVGVSQRYATSEERLWVQSGASPLLLATPPVVTAGAWMIGLFQFDGASGDTRINGVRQVRSMTNVSLVDVITLGGSGLNGDLGWFGINRRGMNDLLDVEDHLATRFGITLP